ncbi:MAG: metallophosphoesterase family protein [Spirochaetota bacterium]|nr:metallophosphoesterase family protein [Spirochaetota bacterium]
MYYIIGDIHGCLDNLVNLFNIIRKEVNKDDILIFLGDYIDRGEYSYGVIEYLLSISKIYKSIFLTGNHESMLLKYINGEDSSGVYFLNGGRETVKSYKKNCGSFKLPKKHLEFYKKLRYFFEVEDFIAVHAGFDPEIKDINKQLERDMIWIRDKFFKSNKRWNKTIIFGHTPTNYITGVRRNVYFDVEKNIIGIDTGAVYGGSLTCLRWPDKAVFQY